MYISFRQQLLTRFIATLLAGVLGSTLANAATVYFDDLNRGPSDMLQIGGVTITGSTLSGWGSSPLPGQAATASGIGLGNSLMGPVVSVDREEAYSGGQGGIINREGLYLSVEGMIESITIKPYFTNLMSAELVFLTFDISYYQFSTAQPLPFVCRPVNSSEPVTFMFPGGYQPSAIDLGLVAGAGSQPYFSQYLSVHPDADFLFGYTIQSLTYTPVPEPGAAILFGVGALGFLYARRKMSGSK
jgi:hypothetical protein